MVFKDEIELIAETINLLENCYDFEAIEEMLQDKESVTALTSPTIIEYKKALELHKKLTEYKESLEKRYKLLIECQRL